MLCEMCGSSGELFKANIEGSILIVCKSCASFGKIISKVSQESNKENKKNKENSKESSYKKNKQAKREKQLIIVEGYAEVIKNAREKLGLKQEELARAIAEKESLIQKLETGNIEPQLKLARKLEKHLKIKLVEEYEEENIHLKAKKETLTLGDLLLIKKKKKEN